MSESAQSIEFEPIGPQDKIMGQLLKDQKSDSSATIGERFAIGVISKTKEELTSIVETLGEESGETFLNCLLEAEESLKMRLELVTAAFARLCVVAEQDDGTGGDTQN